LVTNLPYGFGVTTGVASGATQTTINNSGTDTHVIGASLDGASHDGAFVGASAVTLLQCRFADNSAAGEGLFADVNLNYPNAMPSGFAAIGNHHRLATHKPLWGYLMSGGQTWVEVGNTFDGSFSTSGSMNVPGQTTYASTKFGQNVTVGGGMIYGVATQTLSGGAATFNALSGPLQVVNLTGNVTSSLITNGTTGQVMSIIWVQDVDGGRSYVWPNNCAFVGPAPADITAGTQTTATFRFDGANWCEISRGSRVSAVNVTVTTSGLSVITHTDVQAAVADLDAYVTKTGASYWTDQAPISGEETVPLLAVPGSAAPASQSLRLSYFTARKTETITQLAMTGGGTAAAPTPTLARWGVYSIAPNGDGTLVASIASDTTLFASASTRYIRSLATPWSKTAGQRYAWGYLVASVATVPSIVGNAAIPFGAAALPPRRTGAIPTQSDLPSTFTGASVGASSILLYGEMLP
jgi:hypothetical protein